MKALKPRRQRNKLTGEWQSIEPVEKLQCDACGRWDSYDHPVLPLEGQLPGKTLDCCPSCYARLSKLKPIPRA